MVWGTALCCLFFGLLSVEVSAQEGVWQIPVSAYCFDPPDMEPLFSWSYAGLPANANYSIKAILTTPDQTKEDISSKINFDTLLFNPSEYGCNCVEENCSLEITVTDTQGKDTAYGKGTVQKITPSLPVVSVVTDDPVLVCPDGYSGKGCNKKLKADILVYDSSFELLHEGRCGIEVRGNTSRNFPKKQYSLELRDMDDEDTDAFAMLDLGQGEDWVLNASWFDRSFIANKLAFEMFRAFSPMNFSVQSRYVELFVNQEYMGVYLLCQSIKREHIDRFFNNGFSSDTQGEKFIVSLATANSQEDLEAAYKDRFFPFFAAEADNISLENKLESYDSILQLDFQGWKPRSAFDVFPEVISKSYYKLRYPSSTSKLSLLQERNLIDYLISFENSVLNSAPGSGSIFNYLSLNSAVDYTILQELFLCFDSYWGNFYLYRNQADGDISFTVWDFDRALGNDRNTYWHYIYGTLYDPQSYIDSTLYLLDKFGTDTDPILPLPGCLPTDLNNPEPDIDPLATDMNVVMPRPQMFWEMLRTPAFRNALRKRVEYLRKSSNPMGETGIREMIQSMTPQADNTPVSKNGARLTKTALERNFLRWPANSPEYGSMASICPVQFENYELEVQRIENLLIKRAEFFGQFSDEQETEFLLGEYIYKLFDKAEIFSYQN